MSKLTIGEPGAGCGTDWITILGKYANFVKHVANHRGTAAKRYQFTCSCSLTVILDLSPGTDEFVVGPSNTAATGQAVGATREWVLV